VCVFAFVCVCVYVVLPCGACLCMECGDRGVTGASQERRSCEGELHIIVRVCVVGVCDCVCVCACVCVCVWVCECE